MNATSPYVGLDYFLEQDTDFFFGRERERMRVIGNLRASRLTLLYAESGVGKSSLLRAGAAARLRSTAQTTYEEQGSPRFVPVVVSAWHDDPIATLVSEVATAAHPFAEGLRLSPDGLDDALDEAATALNARLLVILDQFEEFFLYHGDTAAGERFADGLAHSMQRPELRANFLLSIREDAYSRVGEHFKTRIPNVYGNYLHLDYLDERSARAAIVKPLEQFNRAARARMEIEPGLVEDVLGEVRRGSAPGNGSARYETAYLQLVMARVFTVETAAGSQCLRRETLRTLGGAEAILKEHLEDAMRGLSDSEREAAAGAFRYLVTSAKTKIALTRAELAEMSELPEAGLESALRRLDEARVLRAVDTGKEGVRYELFHDRLADAVIEWRRRHQAAVRERRNLEAQRSRLIRVAAVVLSLLVVLLIAAVVVALQQRSIAEHERSIARSQALAATSVSELSQDPERSVGLARGALQQANTAEADAALRRALSASRVRGRFSIGPTQLAAFATHGDLFAVLGGHRLALRRASDGREIVERPAPTADYVQVAPDGSAAVAVSTQSAYVLRAEEGASPVGLKGVDTYYDWAFDADGGLVGATRTFLSYIRLWDAHTGARVPTRRSPIATAFAFDPTDSDRVVAGRCSGSGLVIWNRRTGAQVTLRSPTAPPIDTGTSATCSIVISPDGHYALEVLDAGSARLWDLRDRRLVTGRLGPVEPVVSVAWSPDSRRVATARGPGIRVFDAATGRLVSRPAGHFDDTNTVAFSPSGEELVTSSRDGTARVWDVTSGAPEAELRGHTDDVLAAAFTPRGGRVTTVSADGTARLWQIDEGRVLRGHRDAIRSVAVDPTGRRIASASADGTVLLWDPATGDRTRVGPITPPLRTLDSVTFDPRGERIAASGLDRRGTGMVIIADAATGRVLARTKPEALTELKSVRFSPDGTRVLGAPAGDFYLYLWKSDHLGSYVADFEPSRESRVRTAEYSPDGRRIVTAGDDGIVTISDAHTFEALTQIRIEGSLLGATFSPDGRRLLTFGSNSTAQLWDAQTGRELRVFAGHTSWVGSGAFSSDGKRIVTGGADGTTRVWDTQTGRLLSTQPYHGDLVNSVAFTDGGTRIVSGSDDGTVRLYPCATCGSTAELLRLSARRTF